MSSLPGIKPRIIKESHLTKISTIPNTKPRIIKESHITKMSSIPDIKPRISPSSYVHGIVIPLKRQSNPMPDGDGDHTKNNCHVLRV